MLKLVLVRHAKSDWKDGALTDFDRPLAPRGRRSATWLGEALRERGITPELVLCSPSVRTQQTLAAAQLGAGEIRLEPAIYALRDSDYLAALRKVTGAASPLMTIGHNSATAVTAALLTKYRSIHDFPTAAFAIIELPISRWSDLQPGQGTLLEYCVPPRE